MPSLTAAAETHLACVISPLLCCIHPSPPPELHLTLGSHYSPKTNAVLVFSSTLSGASATSLPAPYVSPSRICLFLPTVAFFSCLPFTKTSSWLVFPPGMRSARHRSWVRFRIPIANSHSSPVTQKGAQQTSFSCQLRKHPREYSLFLSIALPLPPSHTEIIYLSIFP